MFRIALTPSAVEDIAWFRAAGRHAILGAIEQQLAYEPALETRNRKRLRPNQVAEWELRTGPYRVFYDVDLAASAVEVRMVGDKAGSVLRVRGKEYRL